MKLTLALFALTLAMTAAPAAQAQLCNLRPACNAPFPAFKGVGFRGLGARVFTRLSSPAHRARDVLVRQGLPVWTVAKFAYGLFDKDLEGEDVDVYLLAGCGSSWTRLATVRTTSGGGIPTLPASVGQVKDAGGRIYFQLPPLAAGRHRVRLVVRGDGSATDQYIEVLPPNARIAVTDLDGTQTSSEYAAVTQLVGLGSPTAHPGGAQLLTTLAQRGFRIFYLTARPEWFGQKTREWLREKGYPEGILHTTLSALGAVGKAAAQYKSTELSNLRASTGLIPTFGFGNKASDVDAYKNGGLPMANTYYFALGGDLQGGRRTDDYRTLLTPFSSLPAFCR